MIALRDVLNTMEAQDNGGNLLPFSLKVVTYNEQQQTGGEILVIDQGTLSDEGKKTPVTPPNPAQAILKEVRKMDKRKKDPNHNVNYTRNIRVLPGGNIRKIHPLLIIEFNGQKVF